MGMLLNTGWLPIDIPLRTQFCTYGQSLVYGYRHCRVPIYYRMFAKQDTLAGSRNTHHTRTLESRFLAIGFDLPLD